jgi:hypothetical protein
MRAQRDQAQTVLKRLQEGPVGATPSVVRATTPAPPPFTAEQTVQVPQAPRAPLDLAQGLLSMGSAGPEKAGPGSGDSSG